MTTALELAWNLGQPLLLTGEPGCGKTTAAYWAAWRLGLEPDQLIHAQIRSDSTAAGFKYEFNVIRYFRESHLAAQQGLEFDDFDRDRFIDRGDLWRAYEAASRGRAVLLLDEIDKAPRDFPNDLLREFEEFGFEVPDWPLREGGNTRVTAPPPGEKRGLVLVILTSNGERKLPGAFLRRCLHHHIGFDAAWLREVVAHLRKEGDLEIAPKLADLALDRYITLHQIDNLAHRPGLGEYLVWLRILARDTNLSVSRLEDLPLKDWPYLVALLKDPEDPNRL